jgi:hypothetical protein
MSEAGDQRREKVEQLHALLVESVEAVQSSEDWKRLLDLAGRFHHYSFDNQLLIAVQHAQAFRAGRVAEPSPSYVAGFRTWQALGRSVTKGQHGYAILAPVTVRPRVARDADRTIRTLDRRGDAAEDEDLVRGPVTLRGFTVAYVFDVTQTAGEPIPETPRPKLLEGGAPDGLAGQLTAFLAGRGFGVGSAADAAAIGGANGVTDFAERTVQIRADMADAARVKTLAHETGHVLLHDPSTDPEASALGIGHRGRAEVEAESVAYVVTSAMGMDPSGYSLPYVTSWAGTAQPAEVVRTTARRVVSAAQHVLAALDPTQATGGQPPGIKIALQQRPERRAPVLGFIQPGEAVRL